jgi:hypothetical protein
MYGTGISDTSHFPPPPCPTLVIHVAESICFLSTYDILKFSPPYQIEGFLGTIEYIDFLKVDLSSCIFERGKISKNIL